MASLPILKSSKPNPSAGKLGFQQFYLVAIGASAGGLNTSQEFLLYYPPSLANTAIIIALILALLVRAAIGTLEATANYIVIFEKLEKEELVHLNRKNTPVKTNAQFLLEMK